MKTLSKKEGIEFLLKQNKQRKVVPIIGAGFTGGEKSFNGYVPMGNKLKEIMLDAIITNCDDSSLISDIADISFDELSEYFLDERIIPLDKRLKIFKDYFTDVSLPLYKINFLKIWNYIYTLNIDDAIEKNANFKKIVPYSSIRDEQVNIVKAHNYVLKLHGDAEHEILRNCNENIIFSFTQYIASLRSKSNYSLLKSIQSDYKQKNIIFIGCSLKKEPDLLQLYKEVENDIYATSIIYLCCDEPNDKDKRQLKRYGINTILLVDNYDAFYKDIYTEYTKKRSTEELDSFKFKNPSIEIIRSKKEILNIFGFGREIFDIKTSRFCVPSCVTERGVLDEIFVELKSNDFILIKGRRLSGKTTLLHFIIKSMPSYNIIFFLLDIEQMKIL